MSILNLKIFHEADDTRLATTWLCLVYISIGGMCDLPGSNVLPFPIWVNWTLVALIGCFKASLAVISLRLSRRYRVLYPVTVTAVAIYGILCLINAVTYSLYEMGITIKMLTVLSQTNINEVKEFIPTMASNIGELFCRPETYAILAFIVLSLFEVTKVRKTALRRTAIVLSSVGFATLVTVLCLISNGRTNFSVAGRTVKSIWSSYKERKQIEMFMSDRPLLPYPETVKSQQLADVFMVIGESASRSHLSLYDYPLNTCPVLGRINDGLIVFDNAISSSTSTAFNMNRILTFLSDSDEATRWNESAMLFGVLNQAGYHTAWVSNQEMSGMWSNPTPAMVADADVVKYVGSISSDDATMAKYDDAVLPVIEKLALREDSPKFIGVHLMGSHIEYWKRYPKAYDIFNADSILGLNRNFELSHSHAATVAEYDNSIYYTDYILGRIIDIVNSSRRPTIMIYFSDHGENVYDDNDNFCGRDSRYVEVPFVMYANAPFREDCPELYHRLAEAASKPLSTADIANVVCTLTGTEYRLYDSTRDVSSPSYVSGPRYVDDKLWQYSE